MRYAAVFMSWVTLMALYLAGGALLIPFEHRYAYRSCQKDAPYYVLNVLWWGVPMAWFLAPAEPASWAWAVGALLFIIGAALLIWTRRANPFFLPVIRMPRRLVTNGPYRWLRHPGYVAFVVMADGSWLMLGHWMGVVPLGAYIGFLVARAQLENRILYTTRRSRL
jgi:protein-S-isoprenylcysteine O-methyltransferase Ste14